LGQLQAKKVGGVPGIDYASTAGLQTVDYTYNVRGWLKMINQDQNNDNDLFNFSLNYNDPTLSGATALFNGNISETHWETANDNTARNYQYTYDPLNRITSATDNTNKYNVSNISYDKNGNIETLKREGWTTASPSLANNTGFGTMDDLTYTYTGNQLKAVDDDIASSATQGFVEGVEQATEYTYDGNGNMLTDANKGITGVDYNHLNLPTSVSLAGGTISYIYNAVGTKLKKTVGSTETEYAGNYVYEGGTLQFFNHPEGYVTSNGSGGYDYVYQYKDHLGNVRLSYMDNNGTLEIIEENNYYPFGLEHKGYNNIVNGTENNYQTFMGKEHQKELGLETYDFGARNYDPAIGRWMNLDPLAEQMRRHSPYNFAFDNPIRFIDPDGMAPLDVVINGDLAEKATEQLNASSSLEITRDAETGKLSATGTADTESDVALLEAINDENVVVNVNASSDNVTENGGLIVGDVFGGNTEIPEMNITFADQQVNPNQAETIENFAGMETGSVMKHGVLEAYAGAVVSPNAPSSAENPSSSEYGTAHGISNTIYPGGDAAKAGLGASIGQSNRQYVGGGTWTSDVSVKITKSGKSITLYTVKYREQE
ncbi:MAG: RHS repeat-associated core domain-containing protein, partial [Flavobacteriaceae bacterium]